MGTQWRVGAAGATGLDYAGLEAAARWLGIPQSPGLLHRVRLLELAQMRAWAEAREADK